MVSLLLPAKHLVSHGLELSVLWNVSGTQNRDFEAKFRPSHWLDVTRSTVL